MIRHSRYAGAGAGDRLELKAQGGEADDEGEAGMQGVRHRRDPGGWLVRWDPAMAAQAVASGDWPNKTVWTYAVERAARHPDRIMMFDNEVALTCAQLVDRAQRLAGYLQASGLQCGDVISFQLPNWWEAAVITLAAAMTGVVVNPIVPMNRDGEIRHMIADARPRMMFIPESFRGFSHADMLRRLAPEFPTLRVIVVRGQAAGFESFDAVLGQAPAPGLQADVDPDAVKLIMYTSGTTGRPKAVLHSHNTLHADSVRMTKAMKLSPRHTIFCPSPLTHISGFLWALNMPWYGDIPVVMIDVWEPRKAFEAMRLHRCTLAVGATPFLQGLVDIASGGETLPDLEHYICGGAAVPPSLIYKAADMFPNCIPWRTFGATETATLTCGPETRSMLRMGAETDGRLFGTQAKIMDLGTGLEAAPGAEGEILVRCPSMALGYARLEDNADAYDADGYFRMGDLGRIIEGDHLVCTGRKKDLIIRAGENISAKEIEDVLIRDPAIEDVAVVAKPDPRTGEAICAFIVAAPGHSVDLALLTSLIAGAGLARQKTPEHFILVPDLPRTPAGKIRKDQLRLAAAESGAA